MNKTIFAVLCFVLLRLAVCANNPSITNIELIDRDHINKTVQIEFDIRWENSWRTSSGSNNWDAVWLFAKYRACGDEPDDTPGNVSVHCTLSPDPNDYNAPTGFAIMPVPDSNGIFIYRNSDGSGTVDLQDVRVQWNFRYDNFFGPWNKELFDDNFISVEVFGIEMVYIPEGAFYAGSGGTEGCPIYEFPNTTDAYHIDSENAINVGSTNGQLYYDNVCLNGTGDRSGPIPAEFPKGYNDFYVMKYELSQGQFRDMLNNQMGSAQSWDLHTNANYNSFRYSINGWWATYPADAPARACNWLSWYDALVFAEWAALRPITELEWEKAARGSANPVADEYPWGSTSINSVAHTIINDATNNAASSNQSTSAGNINYDPSDGGVSALTGPWRCGIFAKATTNRIQSGASYYGVMNMGGNLAEYVIGIGDATHRNFQGTHGDGNVQAQTIGFEPPPTYTNADWPPTDKNMLKGGSFEDIAIRCTTSDRYNAAWNSTTKHQKVTMRAGRTAP